MVILGTTWNFNIEAPNRRIRVVHRKPMKRTALRNLHRMRKAYGHCIDQTNENWTNQWTNKNDLIHLHLKGIIQFATYYFYIFLKLLFTGDRVQRLTLYQITRRKILFSCKTKINGYWIFSFLLLSNGFLLWWLFY